MKTYKQLQESLDLEYDLPITQDWSAAADFLFLIKEYCLEKKPEIIVECSSGISSLILAKCCQINKIGHVYSLENGKEYHLKTQEILKQYRLENNADILHAPLETRIINNEKYEWYETKKIENLKIDLLVIDGPPGFIQKHSRYPALPVLFDRLADNACVFLDDAGRKEEKEIVEQWLNQYSELKHEYIETERGCSVLKVTK